MGAQSIRSAKHFGVINEIGNPAVGFKEPGATKVLSNTPGARDGACPPNEWLIVNSKHLLTDYKQGCPNML
jgi:hypothetical protein